ncbi:hypothetical protein ACQI4F_11365 [Mycolicibacterium vaccae]|uniref:hypothetical protein n=1 Tax=Mycolicibacterium vaccae TaxID=1810 RepID=UPI003CF8AB7C
MSALSSTITPSSGMDSGARGSGGSGTSATVRRFWTTVSTADRTKTGRSTTTLSVAGRKPGGTGTVSVAVPVCP